MSANPGDFVVMNDIRKREEGEDANGVDWEDKKAGNRSLNGEEVSGTYTGAKEPNPKSEYNPEQETQQENKDLLLGLEG